MKQYLLGILFALVINLSGCSNDLYEDNNITYSYEDVEGIITDVDVKYWFATCPRWEWKMSVQYDDMVFDDFGWANGIINRPSFVDSEVGDSISIEITTKYMNGEIIDRYISGINY